MLKGAHSLIVKDLGRMLEWQENPDSINAVELITSFKYSLIIIQISLTSFSAHKYLLDALPHFTN